MEFESYPVHAEGYDYCIDRDSWINEIIDYCKQMKTNDDILVYDYGKNGNLKLFISMDPDTDIRIWVDMLENPKDGEDGMVREVYASDFFYNDELTEVKNELLRIWNADYGLE